MLSGYGVAVLEALNTAIDRCFYAFENKVLGHNRGILEQNLSKETQHDKLVAGVKKSNQKALRFVPPLYFKSTAWSPGHAGSTPALYVCRQNTFCISIIPCNLREV